MATIDRDILTIVEPTILVDEVFIEAEDGEEAEKETNVNNNAQTVQQTSMEGGVFPMLQIGSIKVSQDAIDGMTLRLNSFIPTAIFEVIDIDNKLTDISYPLDGDVVSLYIRPRPIEEYRPIRIDFDIEGISSLPKEGSTPASYTFRCVMKVPLLTADVLQGFASGNSFDHLIECAEGLGLGFASNEEGTDDQMARICAQQSRREFISQTTVSAYKDDDSFFTSYIDTHYYLCMVNINKQFSEIDEMEPVSVSQIVQNELQVGSTADPVGPSATLRLSNGQDVSGTDMHIKSYNLINKSGDVWMNNGYARDLRYLNLNENNAGGENAGLEKFLITPLNTPGTEGEKIPLRGRIDEDFWRENNTVKYLGKQPSEEFENVHGNYMYAIASNFGNTQEIGKMVMEIELAVINWSLYRYQRIPVLIYTEGAINNKNLQNRDEQLGENEQPKNGDDEVDAEGPANYDEPNQQVKNEFLSGYYVISEMTYKYNKESGNLTQNLRLLRREWPIPGKLKDN
jgi:hypothetical protein